MSNDRNKDKPSRARPQTALVSVTLEKKFILENYAQPLKKVLRLSNYFIMANVKGRTNPLQSRLTRQEFLNWVCFYTEVLLWLIAFNHKPLPYLVEG